MEPERIFIDSDILLDLFLDRKPFALFSEKLFDADFKTHYEICTSTLVTANIFYMVRKQHSKKYAKECIGVLLNYLQVFAVNAESVAHALGDQFNDFEDGIQHYIATRNGCTTILTRNLKDYKHSMIPVMTAESYFKSIKKNAN